MVSFPQTQNLELVLLFLSCVTVGKPCMNPLEVLVSSSAKWERWNHNLVSQIIGARCASEFPFFLFLGFGKVSILYIM